ncbi:MAG: undecaprenyl phosphate translocase family protein [Mycoplasma sp.]
MAKSKTNSNSNKKVTKPTQQSKNNQNTKVSAKPKGQQNDLLKKYGLEAHEAEVKTKTESKTTKEVKAKAKAKEVETEEKVEVITSSADSIGWNKPKTILLNILYGIFMGISDAIPGYSGGTTLTLIGYYEKLVSNIKSIFKPDVKKDFWKYFLWFLPFAIAWVGILFGVMKLVDVVADAEMAIALVFLFGSFAFFSIPIFIVSNKKKLITYKEIKSNEPKSKVHLIIIGIAFVAMIGMGLAARFIPETVLADGTHIKGVTFADNAQNWVDPKSPPGTDQIIFLLFSSMVAGFALLIPGLSGSMMLFMTGWYPKVSEMLSSILSGAPGATNYAPWLVLLIIGLIIGVILATIVINIIIKKWEKIFYSISLGLVSGSFLAIFISLSSYEYATLSNMSTMGLSIGMVFVAIFINALIFVVLNETKKIDYPKFRIFNKTKEINSKKN